MARQAGSVAALRSDLTDPSGTTVPDRLVVFPTGFEPLDQTLDGGLRTHELALVAGVPGIGKTVTTLQWSRNMAMSGHTVIYVCYEHSELELYERLLALELASVAHPQNAPALHKVRALLREATAGQRTYADMLKTEPLLLAADEVVQTYADRLFLIRGTSKGHGLENLEQHVRDFGNGDNVLVVDYLQKVPLPQVEQDQGEKTLRIAEGLKNLALNHDIVVIATVAVDRNGLSAGRLRMHNLRGSSALGYEADVVLMLNEKMQAVAKVHLAYDPARAEQFRHWVVFGLEKHRSGLAQVDMEFRKNFANYRFDPAGGYVEEQLVDERIHTE